jgi:hypothetical protein
MSVIAVLRPHLTQENHAGVLHTACGKTKSQAEEMAAALAPERDVKPSLRKLPTLRAAVAAPRVGPVTPNDGAPLPVVAVTTAGTVIPGCDR